MQTQLQRNRDAIDAIDKQVVELLNQRVLLDGGASEGEVLAKSLVSTLVPCRMPLYRRSTVP